MQIWTYKSIKYARKYIFINYIYHVFVNKLNAIYKQKSLSKTFRRRIYIDNFINKSNCNFNFKN